MDDDADSDNLIDNLFEDDVDSRDEEMEIAGAMRDAGNDNDDDDDNDGCADEDNNDGDDSDADASDAQMQPNQHRWDALTPDVGSRLLERLFELGAYSAFNMASCACSTWRDSASRTAPGAFVALASNLSQANLKRIAFRAIYAFDASPEKVAYAPAHSYAARRCLIAALLLANGRSKQAEFFLNFKFARGKIDISTMMNAFTSHNAYPMRTFLKIGTVDGVKLLMQRPWTYGLTTRITYTTLAERWKSYSEFAPEWYAAMHGQLELCKHLYDMNALEREDKQAAHAKLQVAKGAVAPPATPAKNAPPREAAGRRFVLLGLFHSYGSANGLGFDTKERYENTRWLINTLDVDVEELGHASDLLLNSIAWGGGARACEALECLATQLSDNDGSANQAIATTTTSTTAAATMETLTAKTEALVGRASKEHLSSVLVGAAASGAEPLLRRLCALAAIERRDVRGERHRPFFAACRTRHVATARLLWQHAYAQHVPPRSNPQARVRILVSALSIAAMPGVKSKQIYSRAQNSDGGGGGGGGEVGVAPQHNFVGASAGTGSIVAVGAAPEAAPPAAGSVAVPRERRTATSFTDFLHRYSAEKHPCIWEKVDDAEALRDIVLFVLEAACALPAEELRCGNSWKTIVAQVPTALREDASDEEVARRIAALEARVAAPRDEARPIKRAKSAH